MSNRAPLLFAVAVAAGAGFAAVARAVARRDTAPVDRKVHELTAPPEDHPVRRAAEAAAPVGKWWTYLPAAALTGAYLLVPRRDRDDLPSRLFGAAAILGTGSAAGPLTQLFDRLLPQPPAPPGRPQEHPVFPSGHAFRTSAVALTAAYVLSREGYAPKSVVYPIAVALPLAAGAARMAEEKHWISDVVGAHLASITLAACALALYEAASARAAEAVHPESGAAY